MLGICIDLSIQTPNKAVGNCIGYSLLDNTLISSVCADRVTSSFPSRILGRLYSISQLSSLLGCLMTLMKDHLMRHHSF